MVDNVVPSIAETQPKAAHGLVEKRPIALLWWAVGLTAVFIAMGIIVAQDPQNPLMQPIDDAWRAAVGVSPDAAIYQQPLAMFFQLLGEAPGAVAMGILLPLGLVIFGRWRSALFVFVACLMGMGVYSQVTKNLVNRPRPAADEAAGLFGPLFAVDHGSFPSGHATAAGVLVIIVLALIPPRLRRVRIGWIVISALVMIGMAWQRTLINAHWLSDAVTGLLAGSAAALLVWWLFWPWLQRDYGRATWLRRPRTAASIAPTTPAASAAP
ncbi:phosphatase PAP2 family protein [Microbacterium sp. A196]|uniref:phosphatase PAP2 family protein n=1 Tax=unclassified Microbacterium TaxID=2609290 RepID=UPI003FD097B1